MHAAYRRTAAIALVLLLLVSLIAACGASDDDGTSASGAPPADATTISTETVEPATPPGSEPEAGATDVATQASSASAPDATPAPTLASQVDHRDDEFAYGWNVAVRGDDTGAEHNQRVIEAVKESGFGWVRLQLEWSQFERADDQWDPLPTDRIVDQFSAAGINVLLAVAKAPEWALDPNGEQFLEDYSQFEEFMAFVADRYRGKVQAWEIWNEQNLAHEMNGHVRVADYIELLKAAAPAIRAAAPDAKIVFGGLTPNGVNDPSIAIDDLLYLEEIYAFNDGEVSEYFDILGAHVSSTHNPPDTMWPDNPSTEDGWNDDESFYFRRAEQLRQVMLKYGDDAKPMWITEFGWTTANKAPGYEYGVNNTEEEVAEFLVRSFEIAREEWDFVTGMFVWTLNWTTLTTPEDEKYPWSAVNEDWTPRPAFDALKNMEKS